LFFRSIFLIISSVTGTNISLPSKEKSLAKHNKSLTQYNLLKSVLELLSEKGQFSVILPSTEIKELTIQATKIGFYKIHQLRIIPKANKPINRLITTFSQQSHGSPLIKEMIIRDNNNNYTKEYKNLTKNFYLNF